jgi:hypothetical protein
VQMYNNKIAANEKRHDRYNGKATRSPQWKSDEVAANEKRQGRYDEKRQCHYDGKAKRSYKIIAQGLAVTNHRNNGLMSMPLPLLMPMDFSSSS